MKEKIGQDVELDKMDDTRSDENPSRELKEKNAGENRGHIIPDGPMVNT